ncbi:MAG TPA: CpXC domain-containing protein [Spirochaetia bacterium]|nr:CpXC domain-containing protein [Spirochaetia bacterium]
MHFVSRRIACFCDKVFDAEIADSADLDAEPEVEKQIETGDFMAVTCPQCGKRLTPEFPFRLSLRGGRGELLMVPEKDRGGLARGRLDYQTGNPYRIVVGFPEMAEKLRILDAGFDDRVIEIMKYYLLTGSMAGEDQDRDITLSYKGQEEGRHVFHVLGLKEGEIGVARLGADVYKKISADIETRAGEDPFRDFCAPPWISVRKLSGTGA